MVSRADKIWQNCLEEHLRPQLNELSYRTWFKTARAELNGDSEFILHTPNKLSSDYLSQYASLIKDALRISTGRNFQLAINSETYTPAAEAKQNKFAEAITDIEQKESSHSETTVQENSGLPSDFKSRLNPNYTFETFVVGPANNFAHAASTAIAAMQGGQEYNPLFLYGGSGLGKTHLMQAIGNQVRKNFPNKKVIYVQTEQFVNDFIQVIKSKRFDLFRKKYREADLLLIDDIQFIEGKEQMQEEFFHTFNALYENHKNIVITCDQSPDTLTTLEHRLSTRFKSGLIVDISPPEYETRIAILRQLSDKHSILIPTDVYEYIAQNFASNIRELEGAFKNLLAYSLLAGPIDIAMAREALKSNLANQTDRRLDADVIIELVANYYQISEGDLKGKQRSQEFVLPRQIAMYLCRSVLDLTFKDIGKAMGGKNHTTVMYAYEKIKEECRENENFKRELDSLKDRLQT
ncbi:MAG: chromosomal replication initiator protein DnaA [Eubacteriales bacterium]|nr:chromosomal replication initiator protein DnaA [Eubacteriales bacterium]